MIKQVITAATLFFSVMSAHGDVNDAVVELKKLLTPMTSVSANFQQQLYAADGYLIQDSQGRMQVSAPGKLRWLLDSPMEQWLISDGVTLWLYDPDLEQVIIRPFDPDISATPALLLTGSVGALSDAYQVSVETRINAEAQDRKEAAGKLRSFTLTPYNKQTLYDYLTFDFDGDTPTGITIVDSLGQRTEIKFSDVILNAEIDPELFSFQPPPGVDVIRDE